VAFVDATSEALLIGAGVVFIASILVARYMPAAAAIPGTASAHGSPTADDAVAVAQET
jgi:hypothetical protein